MIRWLVGMIGLSLVATHALAAEMTEIGIGYLGQAGTKSKLSLVEQPAENDGVAGARLAVEDNNTTGKFLNQHFTLEELRVKNGEDVAKAATALADRNGFIIADLPADALLKAADALRDRGTVLLNAGSIDDRAREQDCRANVIHVAPTRSMLADALAQYLVWKQWKRWLLVTGSHDNDKLYADALRRAAARFGAKIVQERTFEDTGGARRTDSGVTLIQRQMPVFTQQAPAYDVLVAADESEVFASYLPYRTWDPAAGRRIGRTGADELGSGARPVGRDADAEPVYEAEFAAHDRAGHAGLDGGAHDRRGHLAHQFRRYESGIRLSQGTGLFRGGIQGYAADAARLEPAAAPADPPGRRPHGRLGVAAGRFPASSLGTRYAGLRSARNQMQAALKQALLEKERSRMWRRCLLVGTAAWLTASAPASAFMAYVSNEKSNTVSVIDTDSWTVTKTIKVGQRPRGIDFTRDGKFVMVAVGDDDTIQVIDAKTMEVVDSLPSGPDPELFAQDAAGKTLYVANENDNTVTVIDLEKRVRSGDIQVGVEPEGMTLSPDGKILINTSETTNMAHFIDTATRQIVANVLVDARPRFAEFKPDGSELWVSSEIGGTVSIIDPAKRVVTGKIAFSIPGLRREAIQPVGIGMTKDGKTAFIALGPANRIAVVDATSHAVTKYLLVGQRVWHMAFTPDEKYLLVTNGVSNDVSVIDVSAQKVIKTIQVGELPWGITIARP